MAVLTEEQCRARLDAAVAAWEDALVEGASLGVDGQSKANHGLDRLERAVKFWPDELDRARGDAVGWSSG